MDNKPPVETTSIKDDGYVYPSKVRRFIVLVVWYFVIVLALMALAHVIAGNIFDVPVNDNDKIPGWFRFLKYFILLGPLPILIMASAKGLLPGSKKKIKN